MHIKKEQMIGAAVLVVVLLVGAYMLGAKHGKGQSAALGKNGQYSGMMGGARRPGGMMRGAGFISGSVLSKDASSMTIKLADGSTKIVLYSGTTQIMHTTAGTADDVAVGAQVAVQGTTNTDGSTTAASISLRPAMPSALVPTQQ